MDDSQEPGVKLDPLEFKVERSLRRTALLVPGSRVLVGVSGGPDSMTLLALLCSLRERWNWELIVLYCHHGLRSEADEEEAFVRRWAEQGHCRFASERLPVRQYQQVHRCSLQAAARECRYRAFEARRQIHGAHRVALAHTADDQAEEVLIGLIRGAGLGGLGGIPQQRGPFVRPLLDIYREEILAYLTRRGVPYVTDASNRDSRFLRARIRHHLIPELKKYSPRILNQLNRTAGLLRTDEDYLQEKTREAWALTATEGAESPELSRSRLAAFPPAIGVRLIQRALRQTPGGLTGVGSRHLLAMERQAVGPSSSGQIRLPGGREAVWKKDRFIVRVRLPGTAIPRPFCYQINRPGKLIIGETGGTLVLQKVGPEECSAVNSGTRQVALVDWEKIAWPLEVRSLRAGDRFQPLGAPGTKKVSRFLMDRKIPREERSGIPLVFSRERLVWVAGVEIAQPFAWGPGSGPALRLEYRKGEKGIEISG